VLFRGNSMNEFEQQRIELVQRMVSSGAIKSKNIEQAFLSVEREAFFPKELLQNAYIDSAFPIGFGQTISQPSTIAIMLELLQVKKGQKVLEVGCGCGYVLALLSKLVGKKGRVFGIDLVPELVALASKNLASQGFENIAVKNGDGKQGWVEQAPFSRILISAACGKVPKKLVEQLAEKGRLVAPVGNAFSQQMFVVEKHSAGKTDEGFAEAGFFVFVPLK